MRNRILPFEYKNLDKIVNDKSSMQNQPSNTYNLQAILDANLDPNLCKMILHDIKSPLIEHSIQMTTDDERNNTRNTSYILPQSFKPTQRQAKQENKPPHSRVDSFSITNSYFETTPIEHNIEILSPLQGYIESKPPVKQNSLHIQWLNSNSEQNRLKNETPWCGGIFNPNLDQEEIQVGMELTEKLVRKKIFKKDRNRNDKVSKRKLSFQEALMKLQKIDENELYNFIDFIRRIGGHLHRLAPFHRFFKYGNQTLHTLLLEANPVNYQFYGQYENLPRILNRLNKNKVSEMFLKYSSGYTNKQRDQTEQNMEQFIKVLNKIEETIENYVSIKKIEQELARVWDLLQSFPDTMTLNQKLYRLILSLQIDQYLVKIDDFQYIWPELHTPNYYNCNNFISQICRNDILTNKKHLNFDEELKNEGYERNNE